MVIYLFSFWLYFTLTVHPSFWDVNHFLYSSSSFYSFLLLSAHSFLFCRYFRNKGLLTVNSLSDFSFISFGLCKIFISESDDRDDDGREVGGQDGGSGGGKRRREQNKKNASFMDGMVPGVTQVTSQPRLSQVQRRVQDMLKWHKWVFWFDRSFILSFVCSY